MSKGGNCENEIAKILSLWLTEDKRDDIFCRSDGSGARFTSRRKRGKDTANMAGDITFADIAGEPLIKKWNIEVKTGYSGKKKIKDADGDVVQIPVYAKQKKGDKSEKTIIKWKDKKSLVPWDVLDFIDSRQKKPVLQQMWEQCRRDADLTHRQPVLIFRRNSRQPCICIKRTYLNEWLSLSGNFDDKIQFLIDGEKVVIMSLKRFCEWANPKMVK